MIKEWRLLPVAVFTVVRLYKLGVTILVIS